MDSPFVDIFYQALFCNGCNCPICWHIPFSSRLFHGCPKVLCCRGRIPCLWNISIGMNWSLCIRPSSFRRFLSSLPILYRLCFLRSLWHCFRNRPLRKFLRLVRVRIRNLYSVEYLLFPKHIQLPFQVINFLFAWCHP